MGFPALGNPNLAPEGIAVSAGECELPLPSLDLEAPGLLSTHSISQRLCLFILQVPFQEQQEKWQLTLARNSTPEHTQTWMLIPTSYVTLD